jgi:ATP-binding cassette, subfamily B, bacterial
MDPRLAAYISLLPKSLHPSGADTLTDTAAPGVHFGKQVAAAGLVGRFAGLAAAHVAGTFFLFGSWAFVGYGALSGRLDLGWITGWALCLVSTIPLQAFVRSLEGSLAVGFGGLLKERLLAGAMAMDPAVMRKAGVGQLVGQVLESEAIESLGASGGMEVVLASLELFLSLVLLALGAAPAAQIALLTAWFILVPVLIAANTRLRFAWTGLRIRITERTVEEMIGHRTRLAQQQPPEWHRDEDAELKGYARMSQRLDCSTAAIQAGIPRAYLVIAVLALAPSFLNATTTVTQQAITLGAILFAAAALERLTLGMPNAATAWVAWRTVKPIFDSAAQSMETDPANDVVLQSERLLYARDLVFTHAGRIDPVLKGSSLTIEKGDFLLLQGKSGGGKSTLATLLAGLARPSAGVILLGGLDLHTLGPSEWRRRVALAPQYHENHILSAPLSFNLLLGRPYPHSRQDLEQATEICRELGLGALLDSMPAGLDQIVGETGWQLSQGERSRVFLSRALLQHSDLVILDESLAALDPENLEQCLQCVMKRAETLMVIAHP